MEDQHTKNKQYFIREYLANLQVAVSQVAYGKVDRSWKQSGFTSDFNRLYYICAGEGYIKVGNREYYPRTGQLMVMPAGFKKSYSFINDNFYTKFWVHFTATIGDLQLFQVLDMPYCLDMDKSHRLEERFKLLLEAYQSNEYTSLLKTKTMVMEILSLFLQEQDDRITLTSSTAVQKMEKALNYIDDHLHQSITIEQLAELVYFHPNYFIQHFKTFIGLSPIQYINKLKMEKAKQKLVASECSIAEIADSLGLQPHYFSRIFKQYSGYSPSQYKQMMKNTAY